MLPIACINVSVFTLFKKEVLGSRVCGKVNHNKNEAFVRGGWMCSKHHLNILFHVTHNSCNTKLKNIHWGFNARQCILFCKSTWVSG